MLLRRVIEHVKAQNWTAVALDFVIVVVGVFIGIQVSNWNDARGERVAERRALERLHEEAENAVAYITRAHNQTADWIQAHHALLEFLASSAALPRDAVRIEQGYRTLEHFPAIAPVRTAYDELTAAGQMQLIGSRHVRDMISLYYADLDHFDGQLDYFRQFTVSAGNSSAAAARPYVREVYDAESETGRRLIFDWAGMRSDDELISLLVSKLRNQIIVQGYRTQLLEGAQTMCEALAEEIGRPCEPRLADGSED